MRRGTIWTDEMKATAAGMKRAGLTTKAIAARLGITEKAVSHKMHQMRARRTSPKGPKAVKPGRVMSTHLIRVDDEED